MKAIITVVGKDKAGIVAGVATKVAELGLNITRSVRVLQAPVS